MDNELHKIEWVDQSTLEKEDTVVCTFRSQKIGFFFVIDTALKFGHSSRK